MNKNLTGKYSYIDSMIPDISEAGLEISELARDRAFRKEIKNNNLNNVDDLYCLVSVTKNVMEMGNHNIMKLLYEKFEYLGFESKRVEAKTDMSFKETVVFFCNNFMNYFDNNEDSSFIDKVKRA